MSLYSHVHSKEQFSFEIYKIMMPRKKKEKKKKGKSKKGKSEFQKKVS
jgi:hypothetical protein